VFLEQPGGSHDPVKGSMASFIFSVEVMKFLRTIHAQADKEFILVEKLAPLVVEEDSISLECVLDPGAGLCVFFLKFHGALEEIETHQRRLAALPRDGDRGDLMGFEKLPDVGLMYFIRHPEIASRIEFFLLQKEAVVAMKITGRTRWLRHDVESARHVSVYSFAHTWIGICFASVIDVASCFISSPTFVILFYPSCSKVPAKRRNQNLTRTPAPDGHPPRNRY
jgi:hypothetical protein